MRTKTPRGHTGRPHALRCLGTALGLSAALLLPAAAIAQGPYYNSMIHEFRDPAYPHFDVRAFSTEIVPGSAGNTESVMAGTLYDTATNFGRPVFVHLGSNRRTDKIPGPGGGGTTNPTWPDPLAGAGARPFQVYNDANFYDQHVADIAVGTPNGANTVYYITVGVREDYTISTPNARDKIKVIAVNKDGTLQNVFGGSSSVVIQDVSANGSQAKGLYPMHSIYRANVPDGAGNTYNLLYICGYVTLGNYAGTTTPPFAVPCCFPPYYHGYEDRKQAFVMTVNVNTGAVMNAKYYDYTNTAPGTTYEPFDFDIAMRLTPMSSSLVGSGQIHVTGSVNAVTGQGNGISATLIRSATMNMTIDQWTLNIANRGHFISAGNGDGWGTSEYGVGIVENTYQNPNPPFQTLTNCYVVSNVYAGMPGGGPGGSYEKFYTPTSGFPTLFNFKPANITVTHVTGTMQAVNTRRKINATGAWGLQVLPSMNAASGGNASYKRFTLAGMTYNSFDAANDANPASLTNIQPFLMDVEAGTNIPVGPGGFTDISFINPRTFSNQVGTVSLTGHDYLKMRNNLSDILWGPTFAATASDLSTDDFVLNAPRAAKTAGTVPPIDYFLGLKTIFKQKNLSGFGCQSFVLNPITTTAETIQAYNNRLPSPSVMVETILTGNVTSTPGTTSYANPVVHDRHGDCNLGLWGTPPGSSTYKTGTTGVENAIADATATSIYPNPAKTEIRVSLAQDIKADAQVEVVLSNMHGQVVSRLYKGIATGLTPATALQLPQVATGLYIVQVYSNDVMVHQQKLSIQQ